MKNDIVEKITMIVLAMLLIAEVTLTVMYYTIIAMNTYTTNATVIATDGNEVYIETEDGNVWCFEDYNWKVNDTLKVSFYNNETEELTDDEIVQYKITGHLN